jgi:hypothetical protein
MTMVERPGWRCVAPTPSTFVAAVGSALRQAHPLSGEMRSLGSFADLLGKLERH